MSIRFHDPSVCVPPCPLHSPSDHHMVGWRLVLRETGLLERKCPHGIGHPDPDSVAWAEKNSAPGNRGSWDVHGCDGCCAPLTVTPR